MGVQNLYHLQTTNDIKNQMNNINVYVSNDKDAVDNFSA